MAYNYLLEKFILPASDFLLSSPMMAELRNWRRIQWYSEKELADTQKKNLNKLLRFASEKIPFYRNIKIDENVNADEAIKNFPIIKKNVIKADINSFLSDDPSRFIKSSSSGSSGVQGEVYIDKYAQSVQRAIQMLWWEWAGYRFGDKILQTGMSTNRGLVKSVKDFLLRTKYVPAFELDNSRLLDLLKTVNKKKYKFILGYASSLFVIAKVAKENELNDIKFDGAVSWGDKLFPHYRTLIENQFQTKAHDTYACTEGIMIAAQCEKMNYHIMSPQVYLEIVDENGNEVMDGELGYVIVTRLDNYAMPLIRYYLGDLAIKAPSAEKCSCGRNLPLLQKIIGRDTDIVKTRSGNFMIVHFFTYIFEFIPEVRQFRVIQRNLDGIEIEFIPDKGFTYEVNERIKAKILEHLDEPFTIDFVEVEHIHPTASGKPQIIQSFLKQSLN
ncbi:MAG: hypothetical protein M3Q97_02900 [Bacteroidota bacterium]|nr:hypothetical protein [Bacteroidota bacterium]